MAELLLNGKRLEELKVSELKDELDKRELSKKGNKSSLLERLRKAVLEEVVAGSSAPVADDSSADFDTSEVESIGDKEMCIKSKVEVRVERLIIKEALPSSNNEQTEDVTSGGEQAAQLEKEVVIPKKPTPGRKLGGKKRGRGGRITSPRDKSSDVQFPPKLEDDSGLSLEDSDIIKLEANLESKTEPLEPVTESVPCELFTADSDAKEETADEDVKPMEEEGDATDMGVPLHVEESAMDLDTKEKPEAAQEYDEHENDANVVPEPVVNDHSDLDHKQTCDNDIASSQEDTTVKDTEPSKAEGSPSLSNSVTIVPSYAPENEELLYEGDVEHDNMADYNKEGTPVMDEATAETTAETATEENREQDLSLVLDLHVSGEMGDLQAKDDDHAGKGGETTGQADKSAQCSLWVSGLSSNVSASDLKTLFSPFGTVSSAKVVAKPGSQSRFGFVTMKQESEAAKCIQELNGKELKGSSISVELAKGGSALVGKSKTAKDSAGDKKTSDRSISQDTKKSSDGKGSGSSSSSKNSKGASSDKSSSRKDSSSHRHRSSSNTRSKHSPTHHSPSRGTKDRRKRSRSRSPQSSSKTGRPAVRGELQRNLEMRLEPRLPEREIYLRRQLTLEQQEKDLMERIQAIREREIREREIRQQALAEQERMFRQKERDLKERELRERRRREELERVLRQSDAREREFRERERRMKEEFQRQLREQEMKAKHERQMRERDLLVQAQKEEQLREQDRKLQETKQQYFKLNKEKEILAARAAKAEQEKLERERQLHDIQQRERRERELLEKRLLKEKAEQERAFLEKQKEMEDRAHQQQQEFKRREIERLEVEKREWERERQHSLEVAKKEAASMEARDKHEHKSKSSDRGSKRPFNDDVLYEEAKRPIRHDIRESMASFHQGGMPQEGRSVRRESPPRGYDRSRGQEPVGYPAPSNRGPGYGDRPVPTSRGTGLPVTPNLPPELINAANKALQTIQRAANAAIPDQHRQSRPMPNSGGRPYGGGGPLPTGRPDPYPPRPGFQGGQMGGGYPPSQARMHDDRGRRMSSGGPAPYQGGYGRRY